ncbi:MAG: bifunctional oligoribonuclease/PAP phosphatase NrnA [Mariprofundaceae bacterium]
MKPVFADCDWKPVIGALEHADCIVLMTHCNPDGDGIGSQLALYHALKSAGRPVFMHNRDAVPRIYRFLEGSEKVSQGECFTGGRPDLIVSLDCGARSRLGMPEDFFAGATLINIDHHASNAGFGDINIVDGRYCATGAMIFDLICTMDKGLGKAAASAIYTAVLTDTSSFRLANVTPDVHRLTAQLLEAGAEPWPINKGVYESNSLAGMKLLTACLATLELDHGGRSAWLNVDQEMYERTHADVEDTEGFIDYGRRIQGVEIAVFIRPDSEAGTWRVTFRSKNGADVSKLAQEFGGGGHVHAAGCMMQGSISEVREQVRQAVGQILA